MSNEHFIKCAMGAYERCLLAPHGVRADDVVDFGRLALVPYAQIKAAMVAAGWDSDDTQGAIKAHARLCGISLNDRNMNDSRICPSCNNNKWGVSAEGIAEYIDCPLCD